MMSDPDDVLFWMAVTVLAIGLAREVASFSRGLGPAALRVARIVFGVAAALIARGSAARMRPLLIPVTAPIDRPRPVSLAPPTPSPAPAPRPVTNYLETMSDEEIDRLLTEPGD